MPNQRAPIAIESEPTKQFWEAKLRRLPDYILAHTSPLSPQSCSVGELYCVACAGSKNITQDQDVAGFSNRPQEIPKLIPLVCMHCGEQGHLISNCFKFSISFDFQQLLNSTTYDKMKEDDIMLDVDASLEPPLTPPEESKASCPIRSGVGTIITAQCQSNHYCLSVPSSIVPSAHGSDTIMDHAKHQKPSSTIPVMTVSSALPQETTNASATSHVKIPRRSLECRLRTALKQGIHPDEVSPVYSDRGCGNFGHQHTCAMCDDSPKKNNVKLKLESQNLQSEKEKEDPADLDFPVPSLLNPRLISKSTHKVLENWVCSDCKLIKGEHTLTCKWLHSKVKHIVHACNRCKVLVGHQEKCSKISEGGRGYKTPEKHHWWLLRHYFTGYEGQDGRARMKEIRKEQKAAWRENEENRAADEKPKTGGRVLKRRNATRGGNETDGEDSKSTLPRQKPAPRPRQQMTTIESTKAPLKENPKKKRKKGKQRQQQKLAVQDMSGIVTAYGAQTIIQSPNPQRQVMPDAPKGSTRGMVQIEIERADSDADLMEGIE